MSDDDDEVIRKVREALNGEQFRKDLLSAIEAAPDESYVFDIDEIIQVEGSRVVRALSAEVSAETQIRWHASAEAADRAANLREIARLEKSIEEATAELARRRKEI